MNANAKKWVDPVTINPKKLDGPDVAFPTTVEGFIPPYESIPEEFRRGHTPQNKLFSKMFYSGARVEFLKSKPGIDRKDALNHIRYVSRSFEPKHEHKEAGVAWLLAQWFEPFTVEEMEAGQKQPVTT